MLEPAPHRAAAPGGGTVEGPSTQSAAGSGTQSATPTSRVRRAAPGKRVFDAVNRVVAPVARSGLAGPLPIGAGLVMLRTAGRRTGLPREVPVLSVRVGHLLMVGTVRPTSQWIRNLAADPAPEVWLGGKRRPANATVRTGAVGVAVLDLVPGGVRSC